MSGAEVDGAGRTDGVSIGEIESALARIPSVTAARIVTAQGGRIAEVHVLANRERAPKQVVRDVQSVALASFGIEVDYRTVSVVQLDEPLTEGDVAAEAKPRVALLRLTTEAAGNTSTIQVHLNMAGSELVGTARGPASSGMRLVARAVVDALASVVGDSALDVDFAGLVGAGSYTVAVAILRLATAKEDQSVSGSAVVRKDPNDAMARASLAALNRLIAG